MKEAINKAPKSALALYIKLYCQKQGRAKSTQFSMIEATKSWVSLSKADKQYFLSVFKQYKTNINKCIALNLKNARLYMKKKPSHSERLHISNIVTADYNEQSCENIEVPKEDDNKNKYNEIENQHESKHLENSSNNTTSTQNVVCTNSEPDVPHLMSEPIPPVRSSMELFEMIKHNEESTQNLNWADLNKLQKRRYQRALVSIKKDYLKQYTAYLEQLAPEQLFRYYISHSLDST